MKIFITIPILFLLALIPLLVLSEGFTSQERYNIAVVCLHETGVERKVVEKAMSGKIPHDNPKYKDFLACSYKKQGYQSENGTILMGSITKFLGNYYNATDLVKLNDCEREYGENHGENAFNALICIVDKLHQMNSTVEDTNN